MEHEDTAVLQNNQDIKHLDDPACWPEIIIVDIRDMLVTAGPQRGQKDNYLADSTGRKYSNVHFKRRLPNGETVDRTSSLFTLRCRSFILLLLQVVL